MRFPGESDEYRDARDALSASELKLRRLITAVAAERAALPLGGEVPADYAFEEWDGGAGATRAVALSELFGARDALFLYSFMWVPQSQGLGFVGPCPSCTSIIDGIDGQDPRHVDFMWPMWAIFDRTPEGRGDFHPAFRYG